MANKGWIHLTPPDNRPVIRMAIAHIVAYEACETNAAESLVYHAYGHCPWRIAMTVEEIDKLISENS